MDVLRLPRPQLDEETFCVGDNFAGRILQHTGDPALALLETTEVRFEAVKYSDARDLAVIDGQVGRSGDWSIA